MALINSSEGITIASSPITHEQHNLYHNRLIYQHETVSEVRRLTGFGWWEEECEKNEY